jgi:hypothetical protein
MLCLLPSEPLELQLLDEPRARERREVEILLRLECSLLIPVRIYGVDPERRVLGRVPLELQLLDQTGARERREAEVVPCRPDRVLLTARQ